MCMNYTVHSRNARSVVIWETAAEEAGGLVPEQTTVKAGASFLGTDWW